MMKNGQLLLLNNKEEEDSNQTNEEEYLEGIRDIFNSSSDSDSNG